MIKQKNIRFKYFFLNPLRKGESEEGEEETLNYNLIYSAKRRLKNKNYASSNSKLFTHFRKAMTSDLTEVINTVEDFIISSIISTFCI
jgi:hypothetical protein